MLDDRVAEHVPGCNMAFRRDALVAIGGFNPVFARAGDDVDVCWRLQARGWPIGFAPSALVWHHHRPSVRAYLRQQIGYGEGEAWLEPRHPDKFAGGSIAWRGQIYTPLPFVRSMFTTRIETGVWGTAAFPSVYHPPRASIAWMPHSPAWLFAALVALVGGLVMEVAGLPAGAPLLLAGAGALAITLARCLACGLDSDVSGVRGPFPRWPRVSRIATQVTIAWLHLLQPLARLRGRLRGRFAAPAEGGVPDGGEGPKSQVSLGDVLHTLTLGARRSAEDTFWGDSDGTIELFLTRLVAALRAARLSRSVTTDDGWQETRDVSVGIQRWAWLDVRALLEDHGARRRLLRVGMQLRLTPLGLAIVCGVIASIAAVGATSADGPLTVAAALVCVAALAAAIQEALLVIAAVRTCTERAASSIGLDLVSPQPRLGPAPAEAEWEKT
jgi:hypothetical protein